MQKLESGLLLYHGSYTMVENIDLTKCKPGKDFGQGFYVTGSYEQAKNFVSLSVKKQIKSGKLPENSTIGYVSVYSLHLPADITMQLFESADRDWLHFVASNRRSFLFPEVRVRYAGYDIIGGKIANDRTAQTLQIYTSGGFGEPGSEEADAIAISMLLPNRLENQFCFCSKKAVEALEYVRSDRYGFNNKQHR